MELSPRAARYVVRLTVRYRQGGTTWHQGTTLNVSSSGVLFDPDPRGTLPGVGSPIEMNLVMPSAGGVPGQGRVVCFGRVVRRVPPSAPGVGPALAATIAEYRLMRGDSPSAVGPSLAVYRGAAADRSRTE